MSRKQANAWGKKPQKPPPAFSEKPVKNEKFPEKFAKNFENDDDEEEEDNGNSSTLLQMMLKGYKQNGAHELPDLDIEKFETRLTETLRSDSDASGCIICLESIGKSEAVWACRSCYELYHLGCTQKWANNALQLCEYREEEKIIWCCPKCRQEHTSKDRPSRYFCFCGKRSDPKPDPWTPAHSCGETCGRYLDCEHSCLLLCHPGPCPPCPKVVNERCFCKNSAAKARRCGKKGWSCGRECGRALHCGAHRCQLPCHPGDCEECDLRSARKCRCGRSTEEKLCSEREWSCDSPCNKPLTCGEHKCELVCHSDACPPCVRPGLNTCPCGKHSYPETGCRKDLPCCGDTCGKVLDCGVHECFQRCHRGDCPPCTQNRTKKCRCGLKERETPCNKEFLCDTKCRKKRNCGRHACNRRCCDMRTCPPCEQMCGRQLNCGNHKCSSPCHEGTCYPCTEIAEVSCRCGTTRIRVPCGRQKKTRPPRCRQLCRIPPDCHHPSRTNHKCHFDACPPCRQVCGLTHAACGHTCAALCHTAVLTDVNAPTTAPATPWERPKPKFELVKKPCPACRFRVKQQCVGAHEIGEFACCDVRSYSCGRECGRLLDCGNHKCKRLCHQAPDDVSERAPDCDTCEESCSLPRADGCTHKCPRACHPAPCKPCPLMLKNPCHCGINSKYVPCSEWTALSVDERKSLLSCGDQCPKLMECGHRCLKICHLGDCSDKQECKKRVAVTCKCSRITGKKKMCCDLESENRKVLECDEECKSAKEELRRTRDEADTRKRQEEEARRRKEQDELQNLMQGGGRRNRKKKDRQEDLSESFLKKNKTPVIVAVIVPVLIAAWVVYANFW